MRRGPRLDRDFYRSAVNEAERIELDDASRVEGLDEEIAVLRMKLKAIVAAKRVDLKLMMRGIDLLVKAVSARYRLSKEAEANLADSLAAVVRGVGDLVLPEAGGDA